MLELVDTKLKVPYAKQIPIHRAHRMGRYQRNKTRPIIAKFAFYPNREEIRKSAKNLEGTQYSIGQQFPKEIQDRRRQLVPKLKKVKSKGQKAHIAVDKLYIDGKLYQGTVQGTDADGNSSSASASTSTASTIKSSWAAKTTYSAPQPGGATGFNVLPNEEEA